MSDPTDEDRKRARVWKAVHDGSIDEIPLAKFIAKVRAEAAEGIAEEIEERRSALHKDDCLAAAGYDECAAIARRHGGK